MTGSEWPFTMVPIFDFLNHSINPTALHYFNADTQTVEVRVLRWISQHIGPQIYPIGPQIHPLGPQTHPLRPQTHHLGPHTRLYVATTDLCLDTN
jgi:hypothetical protein